MYDKETVEIYKKFTEEHYKISSYLLTTGANSYENKKSSIHPVADNYNNIIDSDNNINNPLNYIKFPQPSTYSYIIGNDILVHPVVNNISVVKAVFPDNNEVVFWLDWWDPINKNKIYKSGDKVNLFVPLNSYPVIFNNYY